MVISPTDVNDLRNDGQTYEDLLEILEQYYSEELAKEPFLIKNGIKVIL